MNPANWPFSLLATIALGAVSSCHARSSLRDGDIAELPFTEASAARGSTADGGGVDADANGRNALLAEVNADRASAPDSGKGNADANGPSPLRDCFPDCVKSLRAECERPPVNGGNCEMTNGPDGVTFCYSNGVHEIRHDVNGGALVVITQPDGQTVCYQIRIDYSTGVQHFQTGSGQEVAQVERLDGGLSSVTCSGRTTQTIDNNDPTCATLDSTDCDVVVTSCH